MTLDMQLANYQTRRVLPPCSVFPTIPTILYPGYVGQLLIELFEPFLFTGLGHLCICRAFGLSTKNAPRNIWWWAIIFPILPFIHFSIECGVRHTQFRGVSWSRWFFWGRSGRSWQPSPSVSRSQTRLALGQLQWCLLNLYKVGPADGPHGTWRYLSMGLVSFLWWCYTCWWWLPITMLGVKNGSCGQPDAKKYPNVQPFGGHFASSQICTQESPQIGERLYTFFIFCLPLQQQFHSQEISRDIVFGRPMLLGIRTHRYGTRWWQLGSQVRHGSTNGSKTLI